jgi:carbamoyltransferase
MKTLGISYSGEHDTSCALVVDGKLVFAVSEERLTRIKHDASFPIKSIETALRFAKLKSSDIDYVVIAWSPPLRQLRFDIGLTLRSSPSPKSLLYTLYSRSRHLWIKGGFKRYEQYFGKSKFLFCPHHLSHAISAYAYSPFNEATAVVIDGRGAYEATSIWHAKDGKIEPVEIINFPNSLGLFYAMFTKYLGFRPLSDEWKVMGLAPYGKDGIDLKDFIQNENVPYEVNWKQLLRKGMSDVSGIEEIFGPGRKEWEEINEKQKNIAFAVQRETEKAKLPSWRAR